MFSKRSRNIYKFFALPGCVATGVIYISIGVIAMLSLLKLRNGGADESSFLALLNNTLAGQLIILILLLAATSFVLWRWYEMIVDPYHYGRKWKGLIRRAGLGLSTIADVLIVYTSIRVLAGVNHISVKGLPIEEQANVKLLLEKSGGQWAVLALGGILIFTALSQLVYGLSSGYKERISQEKGTKWKLTLKILAWVGFTARGIILGITGFFLIKAGILQDARYIVNTDKAFDFIGDNLGHLCFTLVAIGTIAYGFFMIALGLSYDTPKPVNN